MPVDAADLHPRRGQSSVTSGRCTLLLQLSPFLVHLLELLLGLLLTVPQFLEAAFHAKISFVQVLGDVLDTALASQRPDDLTGDLIALPS